MFQPQATPYAAHFSNRGIGAPVGNYSAFQRPDGGRVGAAGLVVVSGGPTQFAGTVFHPAVIASNAGTRQSFINNPNANSSAPSQRYDRMAGHDMEAQELAAREFERERKFEGPMVGDKKSSHRITEEYAKADPVYVKKTAALPQKFSNYRPIAGDGNCGWRAVGFSYFECLLRLQSKSQLEEEIARMMSLNNLLETAGRFETWIIEDMTDETPTLLRDLAEVIETSQEATFEMLRARFNDASASSSIIYHLRLLASSWLASNPSAYQGFIPEGLGVEGYRKNCLEALDTEIDHLGMTLLIDVLLKPIGIALEIVYLDRSEGAQANSHIFQSEDANGLPTNPGGPIIHLLYRPSHYDILYKDSRSIPDQHVIEEAARASNIQVNRASSLNHQHNIQTTTPSMDDFQLDLNTLLNIPGFAMPPQSTHLGFQPHYQSHLDQTYSHSPISSSLSPISPGASITTPSATTTITQPFSSQPQAAHSQSLTSTHTPSSLTGVQNFHGPTTQLPLHTHHPVTGNNSHRPSLSSHPSMSSDVPSPTMATNSFRPSKYEYTAAAEWQEPVVFQTSTFKNSHYNTAHYNNPNFQPEEWSPEYEELPVTRKKSG